MISAPKLSACERSSCQVWFECSLQNLPLFILSNSTHLTVKDSTRHPWSQYTSVDFRHKMTADCGKLKTRSNPGILVAYSQKNMLPLKKLALNWVSHRPCCTVILSLPRSSLHHLSFLSQESGESCKRWSKCTDFGACSDCLASWDRPGSPGCLLQSRSLTASPPSSFETALGLISQRAPAF